MSLISAEGATALQARPEATKRVARGARRYLRACGFSVVCEAPLPNGRRADLIALAPDGALRIVEVKSSYADFRADLKWPHYRGFCDRFYFAIPESLDPALIPQDVGLIIADAHGALLAREAPSLPLAPARRRSMLIRFATMAADRYCMLAFADELAS
ncbi:MAG: MmcB family DNA repair protein [Alphaproteobacteria bacterium]|nr:MmcB family DNA repair protein [Alphaproteobacteria bacterium]MBM3624094.1 MmcB family DNA repair protein [Alphaproteobacteria bacterium]